MLIPVLLLVGVTARYTGIRGVVTDETSGAPIVSAQVRVIGAPGVAVTDSTGAYHLAMVAGGLQRVRVVALGYDDRDLQILVPDDDELRLDVALRARPLMLAAMDVIGTGRPPASGAATFSAPDVGLGHLVLQGNWQSDRMAGRDDPAAVLMELPGTAVRGESPVALHVRGGASDQNATLLDGFPVLGATHFGATGSAVNPDAVRRLEFHAGVMPARLGGRLSSTTELSTDDAGPPGLRLRGAVGGGEVRQMLSGERPGGARILLAGRRSYGSPLGRGTAADPRNAFADVLAVASMPLGADTLHALAFASDNQVGFDAVTDTTGAAAGLGDAGVGGEVRSGRSSAFEWSSRTFGLAWTHSVAARALLVSRVWQASSRVDVGWWSGGSALTATGGLRESGISSSLRWRGDAFTFESGFEAARVPSRYVAARTDSATATTLVAMSGAPAIVSGFSEVQGATARMSYQVGLRTAWRAGRWSGFEPRLAVTLRIADNADLKLTAGRATQGVQSVGNEESVLASALGLVVPVSAAVPVASVLHLSIGGAVRPLNGVSVEAEGYVQSQRGLLLVAPSSVQPLAAGPVGRGRGGAHGILTRLRLDRGALGGVLAVAVSRVSRWTDSTVYRPGCDLGYALFGSLRYRMGHSTSLQAEVRAANGAPSSVTRSGFEWQTPGALQAAGELSGDPANLGGAVNPLRLPAFVSVDVGVRHAWRLGGSGDGRSIGLAVAVRNLFDGRQAVGYIASGTGSRPLLANRRSLAASLSWQF